LFFSIVQDNLVQARIPSDGSEVSFPLDWTKTSLIRVSRKAETILKLELRRKIGKVIRDIEIPDIDVKFGLEGIGEGFRLSLNEIGGLVDLCREDGLDKDLDMGGDVG